MRLTVESVADVLIYEDGPAIVVRHKNEAREFCRILHTTRHIDREALNNEIAYQAAKCAYEYEAENGTAPCK